MYSFSGNCAASVAIFTFMCLWAIYISDIQYKKYIYIYIPGSVHIFSSSRKGRLIVGIYKMLKNTWMWNLGLWPCSSISGNICFFEFSVLCLCSVYCRTLAICFKFSECRTVPVVRSNRSLFELNIFLLKNDIKLKIGKYFLPISCCKNARGKSRENPPVCVVSRRSRRYHASNSPRFEYEKHETRLGEEHTFLLSMEVVLSPIPLCQLIERWTYYSTVSITQRT